MKIVKNGEIRKGMYVQFFYAGNGEWITARVESIEGYNEGRYLRCYNLDKNGYRCYTLSKVSDVSELLPANCGG